MKCVINLSDKISRHGFPAQFYCLINFLNQKFPLVKDFYLPCHFLDQGYMTVLDFHGNIARIIMTSQPYVRLKPYPRVRVALQAGIFMPISIREDLCTDDLKFFSYWDYLDNFWINPVDTNLLSFSEYLKFRYSEPQYIMARDKPSPAEVIDKLLDGLDQESELLIVKSDKEVKYNIKLDL